MKGASYTEHVRERPSDASCSCGGRHSHVQVRLTQAFAGLLFVTNSFLVQWLFQGGQSVAAASALTGTVILGWPILRVAFKDLRSGALNTNMLVALAVLALFASAHYQEAGIVSFFMLLGQIIEARTAEGALVWAFTHDLNRVVAVFIVSCPCAFVLATPTAIVAALSAAARLGILIKNVGDIELAARINAFVFDKTGTLTTGKLAVSRLAPLGETTPAELLRVAASAERFSNHPTARALVQLAEQASVPLVETQDFTETAGRGITARLDGADVVIGRAQWLQDNGVADGFLASVDLQEAEGWSLIFVARNKRCLGWVGLQDQTREAAKESLAALRARGVRRIAMVSGDRQPVAARVGREIGCEEVLGDCLPQHKVEFVRAIKAKGYRVAVVGDGVNDAPALAAGDLGIAMGAAGSEAAIHSASIALMNNDLPRLPLLVSLSRATRLVVNQNFLLGVSFVIGGLALSAMDYINPIMAAVLHVTGSLLVVFNSSRLMRQGEELEPHLALGAHRPPSTSAGLAASAVPLAREPSDPVLT